MDPLTAVSLAGTVVQFVDFSCKLVKVGAEFYENSKLESHVAAAVSAKQVQDLATRAVNDLEDYRTKLQQGFQGDEAWPVLAEDEAELRDLCRACDEAADSLLSRLNRLRIPDISRGRAWRSLQHALKAIWSRNDIETLTKRLEEYRNVIHSRVLLSLWYIYI
jgi:hypothetical protein